MLCLRELETETSAELKGSRAARAEYLRGPASWLAERRTLKKIRAVPGEIRDIEEVESLCKDVDLVSFPDSNDLPQSNVGRENPVTESEVRGQCDSWNHLTRRSSSSRQAAFVVVNQAPQISLA